jgi:replicative DNA helicase
MAQALFSIDHEKHFLSAVIKNPIVLAECPLINERDFSDINRPVFQTVKMILASGADFSKFVLIDRLAAMGLKIGGVIEPATYVNALDLLNVSDKAAASIAKEIKRTTVRRELNAIGRSIQNTTEDDKKGKKASELVAEVTAIFNQHINLIEGSKDHEPKDLYGTTDDFLEKENDFDVKSLPSPFPIYNDMYGYFDPGNIYCWIARMKVGKSSFAMSMFQQMALADKDGSFRALVLDTEMGTEEVQSRIIASLSGVKEFYIRHKLYRQNKHMRDKIDKARELMRPLWGKIDHVFIGGMSLDEQISVARRWKAKRVGAGERGLMALDYFKLGSASEFDSRNSRDIVIGKKVDAYKNLSKELRIPIVAFGQANREGEDSKAGSKVQNSSVIGGSDMIAQFCSNIYLLSRLSPEERVWLNQVAPGSATHSLRLIAPRQLGPNELGQDCLVRYTDDRGKERWSENFLLFSFENFVFREVCTFRDIVQRGELVANVQQGHGGPAGPML